MKITILLLASCLMISAALLSAQPEPTPLTNASKTVASLDPAAATRAWLETVPTEKRARSDAYFEGGYWLILWNFLLGAAISLLLLDSGLSACLRDFAERITRFSTLQAAIFAVAYVVIVAGLSFPLGVYSDYFREHAYGLATQSFGPWFREQLLGLALDIVATAILMMVLYAVFRRAQRTWWLWGTGVGVLFLVVSMLIAPVFIAPLFNTYKPITDQKISQPILARIPSRDIAISRYPKIGLRLITEMISEMIPKPGRIMM